MTRSMTAYARVLSEEVSGLSWVCEIHSVNRKVLDLHMHLSKELLFLDIELRKMLSGAVQRGQVNVKLYFRNSGRGQTSLPLLKELKKEWLKVSKDLGYDAGGVDLSFLLEQAGRVSLEDSLGPKIQREIKNTLKKALDSFIKMKETEGKALAADIKKRLKTLFTLVAKIEKQAVSGPAKYREKLIEKLSSILRAVEEDERILREVALFAEKVDVTEEIIRLRSHIEQTDGLFQSKEKSIGRTLDFLTQEMLREINTIASKSHDLAITKMAVEGKAELEKIREQVQNIE